jgi:hypothetical protein
MRNAFLWHDTPLALVRTEVSEEYMAPIISGKRIGELGIRLAVTSNRSRQRRNTRATRHNVPEDGILLLESKLYSPKNLVNKPYYAKHKIVPKFGISNVQKDTHGIPLSVLILSTFIRIRHCIILG